MKKFFQTIGILTFSFCCFYYTNKAIEVTQGVDSLMSTINEVSSDYYVEPVEALVLGDYFIPGINGRRVNVDSSYSNMKKRGVFDKNLLLYDVIYPSESLKSNLGKYIVGGNGVRKNVSLVFLISDDSSIFNLLESKNIDASFFLDYDFLIHNEDLLSYLVSKGYSVGYYSDDYSSKSSGDTIIKKYTNKKYGYCLALEENISNLKVCSMNYNFMIKPSIKYSNMSSLKKNVGNGSIIFIDVEKVDLSLISYLINYLSGKGFNFVTLDDLLLESFE